MSSGVDAEQAIGEAHLGAAAHRSAHAAMADHETNVGDLCRELGVTRQTLHRHVGSTGELREDSRKPLRTAFAELAAGGGR